MVDFKKAEPPRGQVLCDCSTCNGDGLVGPDGECCGCIKMGCRKWHRHNPPSNDPATKALIDDYKRSIRQPIDDAAAALKAVLESPSQESRDPAEAPETTKLLATSESARMLKSIAPLMFDSLEAYRLKRCELGGFLTACLENDLMRAACLADSFNRNNLGPIAKYLFNCMPSTAFGSREAVRAWIDGPPKTIKEHLASPPKLLGLPIEPD